MHTTLNAYDVAHTLLRFERYSGSWTRSAALALGEFLVERDGDAGESTELYPAQIACDYSEHESLQHWISDYFGDTSKEAADWTDDDARLEIADKGTLIEFDGGIIVSNF